MAIEDRFETGLLGMGLSESGQCVNCSHYTGGQRCDAFPDGIPEAVFDDAVDHADPVPGDGGIRFEPLNSATAVLPG